MAYIGNSPYQGSITGGNIVDGSIESIDLATLTNIDINSGSIDGTIIGANTRALGAFSSVGIGTSSPAKPLHIAGDVQIGESFGGEKLFFRGGSTKYNFMVGKQINVDNGFEITPSTAVDGMTFSTPAVVIKETGNVGIGTTSPTYPLEVAGITYSDGLIFRGNSTPVAAVASMYRPASQTIALATNGAERARIDSSGNLLVGKTSATITTAGHDLYSTGVAYHVASSIEPLQLNRLTSDGDIALFRKDTATAGSIGAFGGDLTLGTGITGIHFKDASDAIIPYNVSTGADRNGDIDLGLANNRFKNLYLSGGVYLGGTGAANHLDDYEEGTFTPVIAGTTTSGTGIYTIQQGKYIKVGNMVYVSIRLGWSAHTGTGNMLLDGLPNLASSTQYSHLGVSFRDGLTISAGHTCHLSVVPNTAYAYIYEISTGTANAALVAMDIAVTDFTVSGWYTLI